MQASIMSKKPEKDSEDTNASTFTCVICVEPALSTLNFRHKNNCVHNFCVTCLASHIQAKVDENIAIINCPELGCQQTLDPIECQPMIPPDLFVKWCDCLCKSAVSILENCHCPYQRCSELILNECEETLKKCECPRCKRLFCYTCRVPWHFGYRCSESHQKRDEKLFRILVEKMKWTRCPACGQPIERRGGCRAVKCRCGRSFCHKCGGSPHCAACDSVENGGQLANSICVALALFVISPLVLSFIIFIICF